MNIKRLKHMILILEEVARAKGEFNLASWAKADEYCGTSCCAMGYAALDPEFIKEGLTMPVRVCGIARGNIKTLLQGTPKSVDEFNTLIERASKLGTVQQISAEPKFQYSCSGFDAARRFFDLDVSNVRFLFHPGSYIHKDQKNPRAVIRRIKELIEPKTA